MKNLKDILVERLVISKTRNKTNYEFTHNERTNTSWNRLVVKSSVNNLVEVFGEPMYDAIKDSDFNFGVDETSVDWGLSTIINGKEEVFTIYDTGCHEMDSEDELAAFNRDEIMEFHIGTTDKNTPIIKSMFEDLIKNDILQDSKVYIYKYPWQNWKIICRAKSRSNKTKHI